MLVLSSTSKPALELENVTIGKNRSLMAPVVKNTAAQNAVVGLGTIGMVSALTSDKFAKTGAKVVDKLVKPNVQNKLKETAKNIIEVVKINPTVSKACALVAGITLAASSVLCFTGHSIIKDDSIIKNAPIIK